MRPSPTPLAGARRADRGEPADRPTVLWFEDVDTGSTALVGGKGASLGELCRMCTGLGAKVPEGFVTTAWAYADYLDTPLPPGAVPAAKHGLGLPDLTGATLREALAALFDGAAADDAVDSHDRAALARDLCLATPVPEHVRSEVTAAYRKLCAESGGPIDVAVRSSATREDSATASFAGQYESFLNVRGADGVLDAWRRCAASAFTERVVSYQLGNGMDPRGGAVSVVVMRMVRADLAASGVIFTLDPDSGNDNVVHITSSYGLGEPLVQGTVSPDSFVVWKGGVDTARDVVVGREMGGKTHKMVYAPEGTTEIVDVPPEEQAVWSLRDDEVAALARTALAVERHYGRPMDIEWAKDGISGELFVVQARPETVHAGESAGSFREIHSMDAKLVASLKDDGRLLATGRAVGSRIGCGRVRRYASYAEVIEKERRMRAALGTDGEPSDLPVEARVFDPGDVLVTEATTPDWEPLMRKASLIVTEKGGRTSHAAIVAREFGIPAIVGCGDDARRLDALEMVTGTCAEGDTGYVFAGEHPFRVRRIEVAESDLSMHVKLNVGFPDRALRDATLPSDGVGLARTEFILTSEVGVHPLLLTHAEPLRRFHEKGELAEPLKLFGDRLREVGRHGVGELLDEIDRRTGHLADPRTLFVDGLARGISLICAAFHPRPVLVRLSDMKSNEYRDLLGGSLFEPAEENPMIAWRGASRYADRRFRPAFDLECEALRRVRHDMGLDNLQVMVPFCRTPKEGARVTELLSRQHIGPDSGVPLFLMVELPSNVLEADDFIDSMSLAGGSIGTNDLVQTVYALSRDDLEGYEHPVDARSASVRRMIRHAITRFRARGLDIGMCGQAPSDYPEEILPFLMKCGISSVSVTPDTLLEVREAVGRAERAERAPSGLDATVESVAAGAA